MGKPSVADAKEVLKFLTDLLRGDGEVGRERLRAAELLGKHHGLFEGDGEPEAPPVVIGGGERLL
ncbi:MAG: hypothetical protein LBR72_03845 [Oscillospiraceae bacterium]|jgi:hypothetical protein|nr:hypothetical protein [Oscillospiraceae bacterium]